MQMNIKQLTGCGTTIPDAMSGLFEIDVPGQTWDVWRAVYPFIFFYARKNGGDDNTLYTFPTVSDAINFINRTTEETINISEYVWDKARVNDDGSVYLGYACIQAHCDATIRYMADIKAERTHGINTYAELIANTGDVYTFRFVTVPFITVGYGTYDAVRGIWID